MNKNIEESKISILYLLVISMIICFGLSGYLYFRYELIGDILTIAAFSVFGLLGAITFDYIIAFHKYYKIQ